MYESGVLIIKRNLHTLPLALVEYLLYEREWWEAVREPELVPVHVPRKAVYPPCLLVGSAPREEHWRLAGEVAGHQVYIGSP